MRTDEAQGWHKRHVDSAGGNEEHAVRQAGKLWMWNGEETNETYNSSADTDQNEGCSLLVSVRRHCIDNGEYHSNDINWDGKKLLIGEQG
jgi:hypothetical protein